jgi:DNA-binding HxlR family transcriptional regulator
MDRHLRYAINLLSKRWALLIVMELLPGPLLFSGLKNHLDGISDPILSERLKDLVREGIIERHVYPNGPVRVEYGLTKRGYELGPTIRAIDGWSKHQTDEEFASSIKKPSPFPPVALL